MNYAVLDYEEFKRQGVHDGLCRMIPNTLLIIKQLQVWYINEEIEKRLLLYLKGYKMGVLIRDLADSDILTTFDPETSSILLNGKEYIKMKDVDVSIELNRARKLMKKC